MSKKDFGMVYQAEGHFYLLVPDMTVGPQRIRVSGAGIYTRDMKYLGYWDRFNMPRQVINALTAWAHEYRAGEIARRRNELAKQTDLRWLK